MHFTKTVQGMFGMGLLVGSLLTGCGTSTNNNSDSGTPPADNPTVTDNPAPSDAADPALLMQGQMITMSLCRFCHQPSEASAGILSGQTMPRPNTMAYGSNLTPHPTTGIGTWTDAQIMNAVRNGMDNEGRRLCPTMPRYTTMQISDEQMRALIAYLRSLPAVDRTIPASMCP